MNETLAKENESQMQQELQTLESYLHNNQYKEFWQCTKQIAELFKSLKPLYNRQELWDSYSSICKNAAEEREKYQQELHDNALKLEQEINNLEHNHKKSGSVPFSVINYDTRNFWPDAKEISDLFKEIKLPKSARENLWKKFQGICEQVRTQNTNRVNESSHNRSLLESMLDGAINHANGARNRDELFKAKEKKDEILLIFKKYVLTKSDRDDCWNLFLKLSDDISSRRDELQKGDYLNAKRIVDACLNTSSYGDPYEARSEIKAAQKELPHYYLHKDQRNELVEELNNAWEKATGKIEEKKEERRRNHEEKTENNITRWETNIEKAEGLIRKLEANIDKLNSQEIWNDEYQDRVNGWISENETKIEEVRDQIRTWEDKIRDAKSRL